MTDGATGHGDDAQRERLYRQATEAGEEAARTDGRVTPERLQALRDAAELLRIRDAARPSPPTANRLLIGAMFAATLVLASVLLFVHVPSTEIELDGTVTGVGFVSPYEQPLTQPMPVVALSGSGLHGVELPQSPTSRDSIGAHTESPSAVQVVTGSAGGRAGTIFLDRVVIPEGARVWVTRTDLPRQYRLSLRSPRPVAVTVHADVIGPLEIRPASAPAAKIDLRAPQAVVFTSTSNELDLDLTLPAGSPVPASTQLAANDLRLYNVEEDLAAAHPLTRPRSTISSGSLYFESLAGDVRKLRSGEMIRFDQARGTFPSLQLGADAITLTYQGEVKGMRSGSGEHPRTLMPTLLESLQKREGLKLLWGTALYLFGAVMAVRRWWGRPL